MPRITSQMPPLIAIPTTSGSGSEVGRAALLTLKSGKKVGFLSRYLLPRTALCDPELTISMPLQITAGSGMDAIAHCIEAYLSNKVNPVADAIALDGLSRAWDNIIEATIDGTDREARAEMMMASIEAGLTFQKSLGAVHSLSHPLGALTSKRLHHGTLNAIFLPHVLRFNYDSAPAKFNAMAGRVSLKHGYELADAVCELVLQIGLPSSLSALGLSESDVLPLAENALADHCTPTNPKPLSVDSCRELYRQAMHLNYQGSTRSYLNQSSSYQY